MKLATHASIELAEGLLFRGERWICGVTHGRLGGVLIEWEFLRRLSNRLPNAVTGLAQLTMYSSVEFAEGPLARRERRVVRFSTHTILRWRGAASSCTTIVSYTNILDVAALVVMRAPLDRERG